MLGIRRKEQPVPVSQSVVNELNTERELVADVARTTRHVRGTAGQLVLTMLEETVEEKRNQEKSKRQWMGDINRKGLKVKGVVLATALLYE